MRKQRRLRRTTRKISTMLKRLLMSNKDYRTLVILITTQVPRVQQRVKSRLLRAESRTSLMKRKD